MICPSCAVDADLTPQQGDLAICPACLRTLVVMNDAARLATGDDTTVLTRCTCKDRKGKPCVCGSQIGALQNVRAKARKALANGV